MPTFSQRQKLCSNELKGQVMSSYAATCHLQEGLRRKRDREKTEQAQERGRSEVS